MYGFIDESGAPGVAINNNDYFLVSIAVFESEHKVQQSIAAIARLRKRLKLTDNYEFHCSRNSTASQNAFLKLLANLDFGFITVAIRKNHSKSMASYSKMAKLLVSEITKRFSNIKIVMDSNPILFAELRKELKNQSSASTIRQLKSHTNDLIQVADYVVNLSAKRVKNTPTAKKRYAFIAKKVIAFIEIGS